MRQLINFYDQNASRKQALALSSKIAGDRMMAAFERLCRLMAKESFNPDQPCVPAGNPDAGQWTAGDAAVGSGAALNPLQSIAAATSRGLRAICEAQFDRDIFQCRMVGLASCYEQTYQRYSACLARRQIPPFNY
ncbi:hypothetical protein [Bosea sp. 124]|uniref:hypothetical protein n=1 Tax=Bosea sp. 124 TaxID=2135642 RepID=UPI0011B276D7|nr:hypothetical protein [Bosea sp. 124]